MSQPVNHDALQETLALPPVQRLEALIKRAEGLLANGMGAADAVAAALVALIPEPGFSPLQRLALGEALGRLGDPRLRRPADPDYWVEVELEDDHHLQVGRFLVTNAEWTEFLDSGGYRSEAHWTDEGRAWRDSGRPTWRDLASAEASKALIIPNQPVVGVSWYEAVAYAHAHGARLLEFDERVNLVRGNRKRPYPWGEPFGQNNANTREEALGKPSAVGVFPRDCTPEGVYDLAGNVAEWTGDSVEERRVIHPGSWEQPSMAAWAKALHIVSPAARAADLGFRLAKDL